MVTLSHEQAESLKDYFRSNMDFCASALRYLGELTTTTQSLTQPPRKTYGKTNFPPLYVRARIQFDRKDEFKALGYRFDGESKEWWIGVDTEQEGHETVAGLKDVGIFAKFVANVAPEYPNDDDVPF